MWRRGACSVGRSDREPKVASEEKYPWKRKMLSFCDNCTHSDYMPCLATAIATPDIIIIGGRRGFTTAGDDIAPAAGSPRRAPLLTLAAQDSRGAAEGGSTRGCRGVHSGQRGGRDPSGRRNVQKREVCSKT
jgi:hypothetical protein